MQNPILFVAVLILCAYSLNTTASGEKNSAKSTVDAETDTTNDTVTENTTDRPVFLHALTNKPLALTYRPTQTITDAVSHFYNTSENSYAGDAAAINDGKKVYSKLCQACHLKDGTGRIGPNLTDDTWTRDRTNTVVGQFEIIYGGGAGAMQAFGRRIDQDDILKVMAFIDTLQAD